MNDLDEMARSIHMTALEWKMERNVGRAPLHGNVWG